MPIKVLFVCTGLGRVSRGFESFTRECFDVLKDDPEFEFLLVKGGGLNRSKEKTIFNFHRNGKIAKFFARLLKKTDAYFFEQLSFFFFLIPTIFSFKPDVIFYSDFIIGTYFWHFRKWTWFNYKLLFSNGAPNGPPFKCTDHVQQLLQYHYEIAIKGDENPFRHEVVPYGIKMPPTRAFLEETEVLNLKIKLNLPINKKIVLSVGAVNSNHKRMDYLIREFSIFNNSEFILVILGQITEESEEILNLAQSLLKKENYLIKSVSHDEVKFYYTVADIFVLASLFEGLPRVLLEAASFGLPVFCHDNSINRETLQAFAFYLDMSQYGCLAQSLKGFLNHHDLYVLKKDRVNFIYNNYSWDHLKLRYVQLIKNAYETTFSS